MAAHVQTFLSKADLGVRMAGSDGPVLKAVSRVFSFFYLSSNPSLVYIPPYLPTVA